MKTKLKNLKYSLWLYFILFTVIIIGAVWLFQMFFIETYYQNVKVKEMSKHGSTLISNAIGSKEFVNEERKCMEAGIFVYKIILSDNGVSDSTVQGSNGDLTDSQKKESLIQIAYTFLNSGKDEDCRIAEYSDVNYFCYLGKSKINTSYIIVLTSTHEQITEVMQVIRWQFLVITVIIAIIGFFLAWYLSVKLTKPISEMSVTANRWANGEEDVIFDSQSGYSEIAELADALNYAKDSVSKAGTLQRDLLANVSHDLKTPLTMIKAYAEMIKDISGDNKEKRDKHTGVIIDEADRLAMLVNDILNLSKLQSSVDELNRTVINLSELTERVIGRFTDYVENRGYKIEEHIAPDLITLADEKKIEQVIYNLLGNSVNYTGEDKTVKVYLTAQNDKILLEIIDSGKGISEEKLATIWERYYRFSETNTRPVKGTGLGLSIVKAILDSHGLKFGVRSKKDCGSNFYIEFHRLKNE